MPRQRGRGNRGGRVSKPSPQTTPVRRTQARPVLDRRSVQNLISNWGNLAISGPTQQPIPPITR